MVVFDMLSMVVKKSKWIFLMDYVWLISGHSFDIVLLVARQGHLHVNPHGIWRDAGRYDFLWWRLLAFLENQRTLPSLINGVMKHVSQWYQLSYHVFKSLKVSKEARH